MKPGDSLTREACSERPVSRNKSGVPTPLESGRRMGLPPALASQVKRFETSIVFRNDSNGSKQVQCLETNQVFRLSKAFRRVGPRGHLQGYLAHKKPQPPLPYEHHRALGMVLLKGPRGALFFYERGTPVSLPA